MTILPASTGIGLRQPHYAAFQTNRPDIAFIEVHAENFLSGGAPLEMLLELARDYPVSLHAIGLSIGRADGVDDHHLALFKTLCDRLQPAAISDHLSWSLDPAQGVYSNDLLPLPLTDETLTVCADAVKKIQDVTGRALMVENPSSYLSFDDDAFEEADFLMRLAEQADCQLLVDVNNIIVGKYNHDYDPDAWLARIDPARVGEIHIAGHAIRQLDDERAIRIDDHGSLADGETRDLLKTALGLFGPKPVLLERDSNIPPMEDLLAEAAEIAQIQRLCQGQADAA